MPIERKTRKIVILFAILGVLVIGRLVMFFGWEYGAPKIGIPPTKYVTPTEESPEETVKNGLLTGYYRRTVSLPLNKKVDVGYLVPLGPDRKPRPGAENMIFYAIPSGAANRKPGSQPWLQPLAREFNCTVFTLAIRSNLNITEDRRQYYIYREAGWFDVVFDIQEKLAKRFGLPHRKLLLMGESSGGSMVQRIAAAFPDRVAAAAWCGGSRYDLERLKKDGIPRLVVSTWGCPGETISATYAEQEREAGNPVLFARMPPDPVVNKWYHHGPGPETYRLLQTFLGGMAEQLGRNHGRLPEPEPETEFLPSPLFAETWRGRPLLKPFHDLEAVTQMSPGAVHCGQPAIEPGSAAGLR